MVEACQKTSVERTPLHPLLLNIHENNNYVDSFITQSEK